MRRCLAVLLLLALLPCAALAQSKSYIECRCGLEECSCFVREGDRGSFVSCVLLLLKLKGYMPASAVKSSYDAELVSAVKRFQADNALEQSGTLDDDTLSLLLRGMTAEQQDAAQPELDTTVCFIPTDGGACRHSKPNCSDMLSPRMISVRNADLLNYPACTNCYP